MVMKTNSLLFAITFFGLALVARAQEKATLIVKVTDIAALEGKIRIGLYTSEEEWLTKTFRSEAVLITSETCQAVFREVPIGDYAISLYQDKNDNGKLDIAMGFIPKE